MANESGKICGTCGRLVADEIMICPDCGAKISGKAKSKNSQSSMWVQYSSQTGRVDVYSCKKCGSFISKGKNKCWRCGATQKIIFQRPWFWILLVFVGISIVGIINAVNSNSPATQNSDKSVYKQEENLNKTTIKEISDSENVGTTGENSSDDEITPNAFDTLEMTTGQRNALISAMEYLQNMPFSKKSIIAQLKYEGYEENEATFAAENCGANWKEQALLCAKNYLDDSAFSEKGLLNQLKFEGYTDKQAEYGVKNCGADWKEQAVICAKEYLDYDAFSRKALLNQLIYEGFTEEQAEYGVSQVGY